MFSTRVPVDSRPESERQRAAGRTRESDRCKLDVYDAVVDADTSTPRTVGPAVRITFSVRVVGAAESVISFVPVSAQIRSILALAVAAPALYDP
jgi:hypothetical protein